MKAKRICENPEGCLRPSAERGVLFLTVKVDGAPTRLCGGCYEALRKVTS